MDHRTAGGLAHRIDIDLGKHDGEGRAPIAGGGDPLPYRRYEDTIEIGLGDRTLARRRRLGDDRKRARVGVSQKPNERRQHRRPSLAFGGSFGCAERREADGRRGRRREITALDQGLQRATERARGKGQPLRRDRGKERGRSSRTRDEALQEIQTKERGREAGRAGADQSPLRGQ